MLLGIALHASLVRGKGPFERFVAVPSVPAAAGSA